VTPVQSLEPVGGLPFVVVDVFTTGGSFTGNQLAVVLDTDDLPTAALQALARQFNLSETAFPQRPTVPDADYRLRIFTPFDELPFAGHPSVGAAWVLRQLGAVPGTGTLRQECGAGVVELAVGDAEGPVRLTGATPTVTEVADPADLLAASGVPGAALTAPALRCGTGLGWTVLAVDEAAVERAVPDLGRLRARLAAGLDGDVAVVAREDGSDGRAFDLHVRAFAGVAGVEDPATGSLALALGAFAVAAGWAAPEGVTRYRVRQGAEVGRPSLLDGEVTARGGRAERVRVAGTVHPTATGRIRVPAAAGR
jgi:trans-2,3-dihydro-3-hydroxyanthranilate isomerase